MALGEAMGLLMYSALTFMESNLKGMHLFKHNDRWNQTRIHANTHTTTAKM